MATAECFLGRGTDFETPIRESLRLIENGYENADIVMITDGECALPDDFAQEFREQQSARRITVTGILLDGPGNALGFSLKAFCQKILSHQSTF